MQFYQDLHFRIHLTESSTEFFLLGNPVKKRYKMSLLDFSQLQRGVSTCQLVCFYVTATLHELVKIAACGLKLPG